MKSLFQFFSKDGSNSMKHLRGYSHYFAPNAYSPNSILTLAQSFRFKSGLGCTRSQVSCLSTRLYIYIIFVTPVPLTGHDDSRFLFE